MKDFWPVILRTDPPTVMTREEAYRKVPRMKITYIPATNREVVAASTGGGRWAATQSGPDGH